MSAPAVKYTTTCQIPVLDKGSITPRPCGQQFLKSPLDIPIIGQPGKQVVEFVTSLAGHISKHHPDQMKMASALVQEFMGLLVIAGFEIQDPTLQSMRERVRATAHRLTRKAYITNADIDDKIAELGFDLDDSRNLKILLTDMRDMLCEEGSYAPVQNTPNSPLITP
jgi:hypothetical protein